MRGFMRRRGETWELRVDLGRDPITGRRLTKSKAFRGTKGQAERELAAMVAAATEGKLVSSTETVGALLEEWFAHAEPGFSPKTALETRGIMDRYLVPKLGRIRLARLRAAEIDRFYAWLRDERGLAPATVRRIHGVLRRALTQGVKWGKLASNPAVNASPPRVPAPELSPPEPAEVARLFERAAAEDPPLAVFLALAASTGARRGELVALRWSDVDLDARVIHIRRALVTGRDGLVEKDTKTHQARRVAIDAATAELLAEHRDRMLEVAASCDLELDGSAFVFSHEPGGTSPWRPDSVTRSFNRVRDRAGLGQVRLHDLRHFVATHLLSAGVDVRTVAGRLGHRNAATTLNVYAAFLQSADRAAADVIGDVLNPREDNPQ
jgi:integrase